MIPQFGLASAAEVIIFYVMLVIAYAGLVVFAVAAAVGLFSRIRSVSVISLILATVWILALKPWNAFVPFESDDPDVMWWIEDYCFVTAKLRGGACCMSPVCWNLRQVET